MWAAGQPCSWRTAANPLCVLAHAPAGRGSCRPCPRAGRGWQLVQACGTWQWPPRGVGAKTTGAQPMGASARGVPTARQRGAADIGGRWCNAPKLAAVPCIPMHAHGTRPTDASGNWSQSGTDPSRIKETAPRGCFRPPNHRMPLPATDVPGFAMPIPLRFHRPATPALPIENLPSQAPPTRVPMPQSARSLRQGAAAAMT